MTRDELVDLIFNEFSDQTDASITGYMNAKYGDDPDDDLERVELDGDYNFVKLAEVILEALKK